MLWIELHAQAEVSRIFVGPLLTLRELELHSDYVGAGQIEHDSILAVDIPYSGAPRNELAKVRHWRSFPQLTS